MLTDSLTNRDFFYQIIIYWNDELNSFVAEVPELKCTSMGDSQESALSKIKSVARKLIREAEQNSEKLPNPQGRLTLKDDSICIHCKRMSHSSGRWKPVGK